MEDEPVEHIYVESVEVTATLHNIEPLECDDDGEPISGPKRYRIAVYFDIEESAARDFLGGFVRDGRLVVSLHAAEDLTFGPSLLRRSKGE